MKLGLLMAMPALVLPVAPEPAVLLAEQPLDSLFRQGRDLRYAQRWYEAAQAYRTLLREFPASATVLITGRYFTNSGRSRLYHAGLRQ